ncbi:uncharacterized protein N7459_005424 [Penicillium hispanicum]|uniref:uncharacterized protein n=1 Tax=Penicillium hispanicum TaxID=1080232 RepID=UPI002541F6F6|nr:uncharacterized protein N7459_005424 [Penicillium hispanicum]KAJ5585624.1 hypothetical protein N7459_005424 [Penicillium hispanicum]
MKSSTMRSACCLLLAAQLSRVAGQPYATPLETGLVEQTTASLSPYATFGAQEKIIIVDRRDDTDAAVIMARDTTTSSDSTTSTTTESTSSETTSESTSDTTTTTTSSTTTSDSSSSSDTTTTSTSTTSTTSATSTSSSSTTTSSSSTTTSSTSTATSTTSAELKEWNHKGRIAAIIFSCCLISLFLGVSIIHCARERARSNRIKTRELLKTASTLSTEPLVHSKTGSSADLIGDRSSVMFRDSPGNELSPRTAQDSTPSTHQDWGQTNPAFRQSTSDGTRIVRPGGGINVGSQGGPLV